MAGFPSTRLLVGWQRAHVLAAAQYMVRRLRDDPDDFRVHAMCEGLLDVLEPARIAVREQRALAAAEVVAAIREERRGREPRSGRERRTAASVALAKAERRKRERRAGRDRRKPQKAM